MVQTFNPANVLVSDSIGKEIVDAAFTQEFLAQKGYNVGVIDGLAGAQTMFGIEQFQRAKGLGTAKRNNYTYLGGNDWYYLIEG